MSGNLFIHKDAETQREFENINLPVLSRERIISTIADGTAPLAVTSTTVVTNLNADTVDGYHMMLPVVAWGIFDGGTGADLAGTYTRVATLVTVTAANHGQVAGHRVSLDFTSGTAADGVFTVVSAPTTSTFTVTHGTSGNTSGNVSIKRQAITASAGITDVARGTTGEYAINFSTFMDSVNYLVMVNGRRQADVGGTEASIQSSISNRNLGYFYLGSQDNDSNSYSDASEVLFVVYAA